MFRVAEARNRTADVFKPDEVARAALTNGTSLRDSIDRLNRSLLETIPKLIVAIQQQSPEVARAGVVQCAFAGWENNSPILLQYLLQMRDGRLFGEVVTPGNGYPDTIFLGVHDEIDRVLKSGKFKTVGVIFGDLFADLVALEFRAAPETTGPPVTVVRIDASGTHWDRPGLCKRPGAK